MDAASTSFESCVLASWMFTVFMTFIELSLLSLVYQELTALANVNLICQGKRNRRFRFAARRQSNWMKRFFKVDALGRLRRTRPPCLAAALEAGPQRNLLEQRELLDVLDSTDALPRNISITPPCGIRE